MSVDGNAGYEGSEMKTYLPKYKLTEIRHDWAIDDGEGGFIHCDGRHVELHRTKAIAEAYLQTINDIFPQAKVVRVKVSVGEV